MFAFSSCIMDSLLTCQNNLHYSNSASMGVDDDHFLWMINDKNLKPSFVYYKLHPLLLHRVRTVYFKA